MRISIFGLGYVGCVSLGCYAHLGFNTIGVDISETKVKMINDGLATIHEDKIDDLIKIGRNQQKIEATLDSSYAVQNSDVSIICVGTPSTPNGHLNLNYIFNVCKEIGEALKLKNDFHTIAIRSTVFPGTNQKCSKIIEEISGKKCNSDFAVVSNPEFLREATAVDDFFDPPYIVIGSSSQKAIDIFKSIHKDINAPVFETSIEVAEMIKYVNNSFHALKVAFANEIGRICKKQGIDSHSLMEIFIADTKLNISPYYLRPGFAYGGSCLPKDLKALKTMSHDLYLNTPIIDSIENSNDSHIQLAFEIITKYNKKNIGILGLSFKSGSDDLRNSPMVTLAEILIGKGFNLKIFDDEINISNLIGKNKEYIEAKLPHFTNLLYNNINKVIDDSDLLVVAKRSYENYLSNVNSKIIIDLVRMKKTTDFDNYEGICW